MASSRAAAGSTRTPSPAASAFTHAAASLPPGSGIAVDDRGELLEQLDRLQACGSGRRRRRTRGRRPATGSTGTPRAPPVRPRRPTSWTAFRPFFVPRRLLGRRGHLVVSRLEDRHELLGLGDDDRRAGAPSSAACAPAAARSRTACAPLRGCRAGSSLSTLNGRKSASIVSMSCATSVAFSAPSGPDEQVDRVEPPAGDLLSRTTPE